MKRLFGRVGQALVLGAVLAGGPQCTASPIDDKYRELNGSSGWLGSPTSEETQGPDGVTRFRNFQGGSIYWTPRDGARAMNIGDKFNNTRRSDDQNMTNHLKMYKDNAVMYGVVMEAPNVGFPDDAEFSYSNFICAPWWWKNRCIASDECGWTDDPSDGDINLNVRIDPGMLPSDFWDVGWDFGHWLSGQFVRNPPEHIRRKLEALGNRVHMEVLMYGRSAGCGDLADANFPLLPGWAEQGEMSVRVNGQPLNGRVKMGSRIGTTGVSWQVEEIAGQRLVPGTMVRVRGFVALDCHDFGGQCEEDDPTYPNLELHPVYSIDVLGTVPCRTEQQRLATLESELSRLLSQRPSGSRWQLQHGAAGGILQRYREWEGRVAAWHAAHDGEVNRIRSQLTSAACQIHWPRQGANSTTGRHH